MERTEIREMALKLLEAFGEGVDFDAAFPYAPSYTLMYGYGFRISHHEKRGDDEIIISYLGDLVFDDHTYLPGAWEEVLSEFYRKCEKIKQKQEEQTREERNRGFDIFDLIMYFIGGETTIMKGTSTRMIEVPISDGLTVSYFEYSHEQYSDIDRGRIGAVIWNGKEVFRSEHGRTWYGFVSVYEPGEWEQILMEEKEKREQAARKNVHLWNLKSLQDL